jgi:hypothetical protein
MEANIDTVNHLKRWQTQVESIFISKSSPHKQGSQPAYEWVGYNAMSQADHTLSRSTPAGVWWLRGDITVL